MPLSKSIRMGDANCNPSWYYSLTREEFLSTVRNGLKKNQWSYTVIISLQRLGEVQVHAAEGSNAHLSIVRKMKN